MLLLFSLQNILCIPMKYSESFIGKEITVSKEMYVLELSGKYFPISSAYFLVS
jgi:hypothetical protein